MPPLVVADTVEAKLIWRSNGTDFAVNVLHFLLGPAAAVNQAKADAFASVIGALWTSSALDDLMHTTTEIDRVTVRDLRLANQVEFVDQVDVFGSATGDPLPFQTAEVITLRTALAGRSYRGRTYFSGWAETANNNAGQITAGAQNAAVAFMNGLLTIVVDGDEWSLGVTSRVLEETNAVLSVQARSGRWETQRRRSIPGI